MDKSILVAVKQLVNNARNSMSLADTMLSNEDTGHVESHEWATYQLINGAYNMLYGIEKAYDKLYQALTDEK